MQQAHDFGAENDALYEILKGLSDADLDRKTLFKDWTVNDILRHLHFFNHLADLSVVDEAGFDARYGELAAKMGKGTSIKDAANQLLDNIKGRELLDLWHDYYPKSVALFAKTDPKQRVKWAGPSMSARSSISARLMETWSHAQAIYDLRDVPRIHHDRIKNIVVMGVNTFGYNFTVNEREVPKDLPYLRLTAPSGEIWEWNEASDTNRIEGEAVEFCQVVTQCRSIGDTNLAVTGSVATEWMSIAQCFAGGPNNPPAPGQRHT